jgi:effector-binding domain-containing protein
MINKPKLVEKRSQRVIAIRIQIARDAIGLVVPDIYSEISSWVIENRLSISGASIIRYFSIDYENGHVDIDVGFPISDETVPTHHRIKLNELPQGTYATLIHDGSYENLVETTARLLDWGQQEGIKWQSQNDNRLSTWQGRIEHYLVGSADSQNPDDWKTEIAILIE